MSTFSGKQLAGFGVATFGTVGTVAQLLSMGKEWWISTLVATVGIVAVVALNVSRRKTNTMGLPPLPATEAEEYSAYLVKHETHFNMLARVEQGIYGMESISAKALRAWWETYPQGLYGVKLGADCVGGFGIWPLSETTFQQLLSGEVREDQITGSSFEPGDPKRYWYIGGIFLRDDVRGTPALTVLVREALTQWAALPHVAEQVDVAALAVTADGIKSLKHFKFEEHANPKEIDLPYGVYTRLQINKQVFVDETLAALEQLRAYQRPRQRGLIAKVRRSLFP